MTAPCPSKPVCVDLPDIARCSYPAESGPCRALLPRWTYDQDRQQCGLFHYGGCGGNANNFLSKEACQIACSSINSERAYHLQFVLKHSLSELPADTKQITSMIEEGLYEWMYVEPGSITHIQLITDRESGGILVQFMLDTSQRSEETDTAVTRFADKLRNRVVTFVYDSHNFVGEASSFAVTSQYGAGGVSVKRRPGHADHVWVLICIIATAVIALIALSVAMIVCVRGKRTASYSTDSLDDKTVAFYNHVYDPEVKVCYLNDP